MGTNSAKIKEADDNGMFYDSTTGVFVKRDEWSISAEGSNIESVFNIPGVDFKRTVTNNVMAVYDRLGIEAARNPCRSSRSCTLEIPMPITDTSFSRRLHGSER
jgi:DNA-directed RNA polymerase beta' subunit